MGPAVRHLVTSSKGLTLLVVGDPMPGRRPIVSVHGISRNIADHAAAIEQVAIPQGRNLILPLFPDWWTGYQRLRPGPHGVRPDELLWSALDELGFTGGVDLMGFSGGAQFAHRAALVSPRRVERLLLASAGWYTMPDRSVPFPHGIGPSAGSPRLQPEAWLRIPMLIAVGDLDRYRDRSLRQSRRLKRAQGDNRYSRAISFHRAITDVGAKPSPRLVIIPDCGHDFAHVARAGLVECALSHFTPESPPHTTPRAAEPPAVAGSGTEPHGPASFRVVEPRPSPRDHAASTAGM
ncbi:MAG TPA: hypothetical protein ENI86_16885 [Acidimicrobiales bacterium]|nr:hypothetical protein [Acidimicrobiales bacterium]